MSAVVIALLVVALIITISIVAYKIIVWKRRDRSTCDTKECTHDCTHCAIYAREMAKRKDTPSDAE